MSFHAEFGEDEFLFSRYPDFFRTPGFYVDVGAGHISMNSNSHWLRELGWRGLNIDGNKDWQHDWPTGALIHAVISNRPEVHFESHPCKELSRVAEIQPNTKAITLEYILEAHHVDGIGFLSVDAEGHEFEVIQSMDLEKHRPTFIISEYATYGIGEDFRVMDYLCANGYEVIHRTTANFVYKSL